MSLVGNPLFEVRLLVSDGPAKSDKRRGDPLATKMPGHSTLPKPALGHSEVGRRLSRVEIIRIV